MNINIECGDTKPKKHKRGTEEMKNKEDKRPD